MLQPVRGTRDLLPDEFRRHAHILNLSKKVTETYGFREIATPIFEFSKVFDPVGETSDIITKETYTFKDRHGESLTLRPEGTAPVVRSVISNGLAQQAPLKYFYGGPMFRYDRPQKGRYRQFHQIGVELIGVQSPQGDIETIAAAYDVLKELGLIEKITLHINSLGDQKSRETYGSVLLAYLETYKTSLSQDSQDRLRRNPLRILDSKDPGDQEIIKSAPSYEKSLTSESMSFFQDVLEGLENLKIPYERSPTLVRGLDYYCHTAFEFISTHLGSQGTVLGGGRYDGLMKALGGSDLPGIGWAAGIERLAMLADLPPLDARPIVVIPLGEAEEKRALQIAYALRQEGYYVEQSYGGNMSKRLKKAHKLKAEYGVIMGEDEATKESALIRNFDTGVQDLVNLQSIGTYFKTRKTS